MTNAVANIETKSLDRIVRNIAKLTTSVIKDSWNIGHQLLAARELLSSNKAFSEWREEHLGHMGITQVTAQRLMQVARRFPTLDTLPGGLQMSTLYAISAPSTSDRVAEYMIEQVTAQPDMSAREANRMVADCKRAEREGNRPDSVVELREPKQAAKTFRNQEVDDEPVEEVDQVLETWRVRAKSLKGKSDAKRREHLSAMLQALREAGLLYSKGCTVYAHKGGVVYAEGDA
jgi:hypothetical protein